MEWKLYAENKEEILVVMMKDKEELKIRPRLNIIFFNSSSNVYKLTIFGWKNALFHGGNLDKDCIIFKDAYLSKLPARYTWETANTMHNF